MGSSLLIGVISRTENLFSLVCFFHWTEFIHTVIQSSWYRVKSVLFLDKKLYRSVIILNFCLYIKLTTKTDGESPHQSCCIDRSLSFISQPLICFFSFWVLLFWLQPIMVQKFLPIKPWNFYPLWFFIMFFKQLSLAQLAVSVCMLKS